jgi:exodeoxyribonuclease VII small subunit
MKAIEIAVIRWVAMLFWRLCYPKPTPTRQAGLTAMRCLCTVLHDMSTRKGEKEPKPVDFETAMRDLEEIVERLEQGELPLEESLAAFERGVLLTRTCQVALKEAEQKVEILLKKTGESVPEPFTPEDS